MNERQQLAGREAIVRRYGYEDGLVFMVDVGPAEGSVDVVDDTAIIVVGDDQFEVDLPAGEARAFMKNGVVSVEVDR